jgi:DNA-binding transcriptional MerR regulator
MSQLKPKQWYVKELSALTKVSVRTLHHYDRIGLLKPSVRLLNGYRLYSESDLLKLQQILALKFFGFELKSIKGLMKGEITQVDHFQAQQRMLIKKTQHLQDATQILDSILKEWGVRKSIPWETVIQLIEVYRMTKELEQTWAAKVYTPEQLKQFAAMKSKFSDEEIQDYQEKWANIIKETQQHLDEDPRSAFAKDLGKRWLDLVNSAYGGAENFHLRTRIWDAYKKDEIPDSPIPQDVVLWIDKAMDAYIRERIYGVLAKFGAQSDDKVAKEWEDLVDYMYGIDEPSRQALYQAALKDEKVTETAKKWLKKTYKL